MVNKLDNFMPLVYKKRTERNIFTKSESHFISSSCYNSNFIYPMKDKAIVE